MKIKNIISPAVPKLFLLFLVAGIGLSQPKLVTKVDTKLGMMNYLFDEVNINDGTTALTLWIETFKKSVSKKGIKDVNVEYQLYTSINDLEKDIEEEEIVFITIKTVDYFNLKEPSKLVPFLTGSRSTRTKFEQLLLVAGNKSGIKSIKDIKDTEILLPKTFLVELSKMWVRLELIDAKKFNYKNPKIKYTSFSESNLLLGVFFGKYDCAVISSAAYQLVCELNPQVKENTNIIAISPLLINSLFAHAKNADPDLVYTYRTVSENLHEEPEGKQILTLFKTDRVAFFTEAELEETEKLIKRHNSIFKSIID